MGIYILIIFDENDLTKIADTELFSARPTVRDASFFGDEIPRWELRLGNIDGGDSILVDKNTPDYILDHYLTMGR